MKRLILAVLMLFMLSGTAHAADCAATVTVMHRDVWGGTQVSFGYIMVSAGTYPSGSYITLAEGAFGMSSVESISLSEYGSTGYTAVYNSGYLYLMSNENNTATVTEDPVTTDSDRFIVTDDNSAATNGKLLTVMPLPGSSMGQFVSLESRGGTTSAHSKYCFLAAADSATYVLVSDTLKSEVELLAKPTCADTVFFDDDATNHEQRLMYAGNSIGDMGTLYIPYSNGRMIAVVKKTNSEITQAAALPLYFDEDAGLDDKLLSVTNGNANSSFGADITYSSIAKFRNMSQILFGGETVTLPLYYYFIAVGF